MVTSSSYNLDFLCRFSHRHIYTHTHARTHTHTQITIFLIVIGMIFNFRFAFSNLQPSIKKPYSCMLWFLWSSTIFLTLLLGATWVFAMLMVNFYGLDSATLGWIFLGVSAALVSYAPWNDLFVSKYNIYIATLSLNIYICS